MLFRSITQSSRLSLTVFEIKSMLEEYIDERTFMSAITSLFANGSGASSIHFSKVDNALVASASSAVSTRRVRCRSSFLHKSKWASAACCARASASCCARAAWLASVETKFGIRPDFNAFSSNQTLACEAAHFWIGDAFGQVVDIRRERLKTLLDRHRGRELPLEVGQVAGYALMDASLN